MEGKDERGLCKMNVTANSLKEAIIRVLEELPSERVTEVLDFTLFLKQRSQAEDQPSQRLVFKAIPADRLDPLVGLVSWGGDALADTERLYEA